MRRMARNYGKEDDPTWIARTAVVCFTEDALRWHVKLSKDIRNDWELLEEALLDRFPAPEDRQSKYSIS
jgi:hypothetical protein